MNAESDLLDLIDVASEVFSLIGMTAALEYP